MVVLQSPSSPSRYCMVPPLAVPALTRETALPLYRPFASSGAVDTEEAALVMEKVLETFWDSL